GCAQAPQDPGLYRQRPAPPSGRVPGNGRAFGEKRPAQIPRGHRRGHRQSAGGLYRPPAGQEFRQIADPPRRRSDPVRSIASRIRTAVMARKPFLRASLFVVALTLWSSLPCAAGSPVLQEGVEDGAQYLI